MATQYMIPVVTGAVHAQAFRHGSACFPLRTDSGVQISAPCCAVVFACTLLKPNVRAAFFPSRGESAGKLFHRSFRPAAAPLSFFGLAGRGARLRSWYRSQPSCFSSDRTTYRHATRCLNPKALNPEAAASYCGFPENHPAG
jgi:hypothetical protein